MERVLQIFRTAPVFMARLTAERGVPETDPRIARLAIHSASAAALFLIETRRLRFPSLVRNGQGRQP